VNDKNIQFDKNDFGAKEDAINFSKNLKIVNNLLTSVVNLVIPDAFFETKRFNYFIIDTRIR
jgi:hypothetical protein